MLEPYVFALLHYFHTYVPFQALHAAQKKLQEEEDELREATKELEEATRRRKKLEVKNAKASKDLEQELEALRKTHQRQDRLREEYNALLARVIASEARRVRMAGEVGAENTAAGRTEEQFKMMQEEKRLQDMYLDALRQNVEDMELRNREYQEQVRLPSSNVTFVAEFRTVSLSHSPF